MFNTQRFKTPAARKRIDLGIVIAGFVVALILGVLTWFNYQDRATPTDAQLLESRQPPTQ